jgi:hypothetical protein
MARREKALEYRELANDRLPTPALVIIARRARKNDAVLSQFTDANLRTLGVLALKLLGRITACESASESMSSNARTSGWLSCGDFISFGFMLL